MLVLEPDVSLRQTMGANPMNPDNRAEVMLATRDAVTKTLRSLDLQSTRAGGGGVDAFPGLESLALGPRAD